jgi:tRNA(fMet)-specific endonuclease VapC
VLVVDTDVVSYLFKQDTRSDLYKPHLRGHLLVISPMTRAELEDWALEHNWGERRRDEMRVHLKQFLLAPFDEYLCVKWAEATDSARRRGRRINGSDAWVAAVALHYDVPLVTHNGSDYVGVANLKVITQPSSP